MVINPLPEEFLVLVVTWVTENTYIQNMVSSIVYFTYLKVNYRGKPNRFG